MLYIIKEPADIIRYIESSIKYEEKKLDILRYFKDNPQYDSKVFANEFLPITQIEFISSNNETIKLFNVDEERISINVTTSIPSRFYTGGSAEITSGKGIKLEGAMFFGDTILNCKDTLMINNTYFNPEKELQFNERKLTQNEIEAISNSIFHKCSYDASISIEVENTVNIIDYIQKLDPLEMEKLIESFIKDSVDEIIRYKSFEVKHFYELEKCIDPQPDKEFVIPCMGINDFVFVEPECEI